MACSASARRTARTSGTVVEAAARSSSAAASRTEPLRTAMDARSSSALVVSSGASAVGGSSSSSASARGARPAAHAFSAAATSRTARSSSVRAQPGGPLVGRGRDGVGGALHRPRGCAVQHLGDPGIGRPQRLREVPGAPVDVVDRQGNGHGRVHGPALLRRAVPIDRGAQQGVAEGHVAADHVGQPRVLRRRELGRRPGPAPRRPIRSGAGRRCTPRPRAAPSERRDRGGVRDG